MRPLLRHRLRVVLHGEDTCTSFDRSGSLLEGRRSEASFVLARCGTSRGFLRGSRRGFCAGIASRRGSFESGPRYFIGAFGERPFRPSQDGLRARLRLVRARLRPVRARLRPVRARLRPIRARLRPIRAAVGGVRAAVGGVRAAVGGVRAAVGGVRAAVGGVRAPAVTVARGPPARGFREVVCMSVNCLISRSFLCLPILLFRLWSTSG